MTKVPKALYWELRARQRDVEVFLRDMQMLAKSPWSNDGDVTALMQQRFQAALEAQNRVIEAVRTRHGVEPPYVWHDDTHSLAHKRGTA